MKKIALLAALGIASVSQAQVNYLENPNNMALRLGYVYPVDDVLRGVGTSYFGLGADFWVDFNIFKGAETTLSLDWMASKFDGSGGNVYMLALNQRWYMGDSPVQRSYFFAGLGVASVDVTTAKGVLGVRGGYGKEFGDHIFGEIIVTYTDASAGARGTTAGFYLGYRF